MGGLRTDRMDYRLYDRMLRKRPQIAVINIGGNDITPTSAPRDIFKRICNIVEDLHDSGVKHVFIAEIMTRGDFSKCPGLTKVSFDLQRKKINHLLAKTYKEKLIRFSDIRFPKDYSYDGVHMGTEVTTTRNTGMKKYESRIRRILCSVRS